jgi:hypothetical protein
MQQQQPLSQLLEALKSKGLSEISITHLEASRQLLIKFECEPTIQAIARLTVLKYQHPELSDAELIDSHLDLQKERSAGQSSYGSELAKNVRDDIWESLEQSGIINQIAQDLRFKMSDRVISAMVSPPDRERQKTRHSALQRVGERLGFLSKKQDDVIDVDYLESADDLDGIISQALGANPSQLRLIGDTFRGNSGNFPAIAGGSEPTKKPQLSPVATGKK